MMCSRVLKAPLAACVITANSVSYALVATAAMVPPGLNPGDDFYIIFVTSTKRDSISPLTVSLLLAPQPLQHCRPWQTLPSWFDHHYHYLAHRYPAVHRPQ